MVLPYGTPVSMATAILRITWREKFSCVLNSCLSASNGQLEVRQQRRRQLRLSPVSCSGRLCRRYDVTVTRRSPSPRVIKKVSP
ncbi:hypothetical protein CEXT_747681 [Caerostris extrusa]|uniref:Secreted protein n=1 Tax=Caerostris extrusa TaxID=172846 RepID=A0AAV4T6Y5_CAEEX|nr:hypothetical protein CEXT_747681 [Caerostris extrusa]